MSRGMGTVILNVDDNESSRYVISRLLRNHGFTVKEAGSGQQALELVRQKTDLVLLDVNLPDIDGMEVCRRIKSDRRTAFIPVLHLSATAISEQDRTQGLEHGADAYLTHPVDPGLLLATINALLRAHRAERDLRAAARQWQTTFNAISHGVCLLDAEGRVQRVNRAMAALAGRPSSEVVGLRYDEVLTGAETPEGGWPFERVRKTLARESAEVRLGNRWFEFTADPVLDENNALLGAVRTVVEITARKREQQERDRLVQQIEAERARLQTVLNQLPAGVIIAEPPSGRMVFINEQAPRILGLPLLPAAGIEEYGRHKGFHPDGRLYKHEEWPLARSVLRGEVVSGEQIEIERGDGSRCTIRASSAPILNGDGEITSAVVAFYDVTERKELEEQFRQSQKMEAVGRLAGGVAHDFNNLLTIIGGYGQMVMDNLPARDPLRKDLEAILEAATRATLLTRQLLTFSRRQLSQPRVLDLNRLVSRMNRMLRRVIGEDIELSVQLKPDLPRIKADPGQLEQVIMNLAVNARDAMPKGGTLSLETSDLELVEGGSRRRPKLPAGRYVVLSIRDTGIGMDAEVRSHLFEPFFTTKPKGKGTGLGLSTVYGIVKQSGGEIEAQSEPGKGTLFQICLPTVAEAVLRSEPAHSVAPELRGSETILLVEDEDEVRRFTRELLVRQGYAVLEAASGAEALRVWKRHRQKIDLLLTDVIMPQMSGHELAVKLRALEPALKVLYISGYTDDVIAQHGVLEPGTTLLPKPFTQETLGRKVRKVLDAPAGGI